jgi:hypothetical protein
MEVRDCPQVMHVELLTHVLFCGTNLIEGVGDVHDDIDVNLDDIYRYSVRGGSWCTR